MFFNIKSSDCSVRLKSLESKNKLLSKNLTQLKKQVDKLIEIDSERRKETDKITQLELENQTIEKEINVLQEQRTKLIQELL